MYFTEKKGLMSKIQITKSPIFKKAPDSKEPLDTYQFHGLAEGNDPKLSILSKPIDKEPVKTPGCIR